MTQTIPLSIALGAANTGLGIGYRVLELDRTEYSAFTTTDVDESNVAGTYYVTDGIAAPDAGGYVVVGTDGVDYAEAGIDPAAASSAGSGAVTWTYTLTSSVDAAPIAGADVWATTDSGGSNVVASGVTDTNGEVTFYLDAGTYYVWRQLAGWNFTNPDTEVVA